MRKESGVCDARQMTYADSWAYLQRYRQWQRYICPDHTGEFADVAVGDPWYREVQAGEAGTSLTSPEHCVGCTTCARCREQGLHRTRGGGRKPVAQISAQFIEIQGKYGRS